MEKDILRKNCRDERNFIHDIASPIGTALLVLDDTLETLKQSSSLLSLQGVEIQALQQAYEALIRVQNMMAVRRTALVAIQAEGDSP